MTRQLRVAMDGTHAGTVAMSAGGALTFEYDDTYRALAGPTPLSLSMPLATLRHRQRAVLPFLQGLLPDNDLALEAMARTYQVSARSPFALLEHVGHDVAGALQLTGQGDEVTDATADRSRLVPMDDDEVAADLRRAIEAYTSGAPVRTAAARMSLSGAQPKIALVRRPDDTWATTTPGVPTTHILKPEYVEPRTPGDRRFPDLTVVELFSLSLARHAGLPVPHAWMWHSPDGDLRALVLERYDCRVGPDGYVHRRHQEDLCQALSVPPAKKYQHLDGGPGVGQVAQLLRTRLSPLDRDQVARDFLRAVTFNVAIVNTDAHAKNYSLLLDGSSVALSPLYDVTSIALYVDRDVPPLHFPMSIDGTYRIADIHPGRLAAEGERLGIPADEAHQIVHQTLQALPDAFDQARADVRDLPSGTRVADTVAHGLRAVSPLYGRGGTVTAIDLGSAG